MLSSLFYQSRRSPPSSPVTPVSGARRTPLVCLALLLASSVGCATSKSMTADPNGAATVERLRAENAAQLRRVEELENQVFVLTSELDARRAGEPPPAAVAPPGLPEVKLARPDKNGAGEASPPESLVDTTEVEYAGAAAERGTGKRPVLKLWGSNDAETSQSDDGASADESGPATEPRPRDRQRLALTRRPRHAELPPARVASRSASSRPVAVPLVPPAPVAPAKPEALRADQELYQAALVHLRAGRHDEAVAALRGFVAAHPQHDLADNAQYWLGECFYDRKDYSTALREFRRVADEFPAGNKVPDALLKLGLSYLALGSARPGQEALADLVRRFPRHPATALAEAKLAELGPAAALGPAPRNR